MPKRVCVGVVTSDKMAKTRVVEISRLVKHSVYGRYMRRKTVCYVHDEAEQSSQGDTVEIVESRPRSRVKRWELVKIVEKGRDQAMAALSVAGPTTGAESDASPVSEMNQDSQP
jgi:small subunit ribosomal protein S17